MKRSLSIMLAALMMVTAGGMLAACGSGDDDGARTAIPRSRLQQPRRTRAELSPEEQQAFDERQAKKIARVMVWPDDKGPSRDVLADSKSCQAQLLADRQLANGNPLVQLTWTTRCMTNKGWVLDPEAKKQLTQ